MLGKKVLFAYQNGAGERVEDSGLIMDKVKLTDAVRDKDGNFIGACAVDIYLIKKEDGNFISMHPTNLIKEI